MMLIANRSALCIGWLSCETPNTPVVLSDEHQAYKWLDVESAVEIVQFADMQQTLREANNFVEKLL